MSEIVRTSQDYNDILSQKIKEGDYKSKWEELFFSPLKTGYDTAVQQTTNKADYDISNAYANYKKRELALLRNNNIFTGTQADISSNLKNAYSESYSAIKGNEQSRLASLNTNLRNVIENYSSQLASLENSIYAFKGINTDLLEMDRNAKDADGNSGLGYYKNLGNGTYEITDYGREFFDKALNTKDTETKQFFTDYLKENDEKLYNFYTKNSPIIRELIGGLKGDDTKYEPSEYSKLEKQPISIEVTKDVQKVGDKSYKVDVYSKTPASNFRDQLDTSKLQNNKLYDILIRNKKYRMVYKDRYLYPVKEV